MMVWRFLSLALLLTISFANINGINSECKIPLTSSHMFLVQVPLVFQQNGELYPTTYNEKVQQIEMNIKNNEEVMFSCGPNYLRNFMKKEVLNVKCNGETGNFSVVANPEQEMSIKMYSCDLRVIEEVLIPVEGCTNEKWTSVNFGYVDPNEKLTYVLGSACYDMNEARTIFAHVKMGKTGSNILQKLDKNYLVTNQHPDGRYKIELLRSLNFDEIYENIRTHLNTSPPPMGIQHFIDESLLSSSQFQAVKKLSWNYYIGPEKLDALDSLKQDIRHLSEGINIDLYVGSHGVNFINGKNGHKLKIYLRSHQRFPMPELIWFVVKYQNRATAFGVYNDLIEGNINREHETAICQSECEKITWLSDANKRNRKSLVCCSYADLKKVVNKVPNLDDVTDMLL
ncbi:uncharacterized protein LOC119679181 [Teleopsis dalmanni]|uniref:uncharacterized protein LOC119679181 n=1 Tax=Teleopsis dalmanni TaxID=139649 RepID=UPI0018CD5382|nr:uncharacterized protein LOC119679181 [Teleopsis dalmanni]